METTLDELGRVMIPQQVREDLGLAPGMALKIEERGDSIVLTPLEQVSALAYEDGILVFTGELQGNVDDALGQDREERLRKLAGLE
jgi:AbrB family looped-hinge helix DNA binding protein